MSVIGKSAIKAIETLKTTSLPRPDSTGRITDGRSTLPVTDCFPDIFERQPAGVLNSTTAANLPPGAHNLVNPGAGEH
jgi:hypothetical protein